MTFRVRALSDAGLDLFRASLQRMRNREISSPPASLLTDPTLSFSASPEVSIETSGPFDDKMALGRYLTGQLAPLFANPNLESSVGLWSWLAAAFFDIICPAGPEGRTVGADHRYVLSVDAREQYRHLIRTPYSVYSLHRECSTALLSGKPSTHGEASEQILGREYLRSNKGLFEAIDRLYVQRSKDGSQVSIKRRARDKGRPGTMRRLGKVLRQYDLTFDLYGMSGDEIFNLLPEEFGDFKRA